MLYRGMYDDTLHLLSGWHPTGIDPDASVRKLAIEAIALTRQHRPVEGNKKLDLAGTICSRSSVTACGEWTQAKGIVAVRNGQPDEGQRLFEQSLAFAESHKDPWQRATALLNLGFLSLQRERYDEALAWLEQAQRAADEAGANDLAERSSGNIGWAYFRLGDRERALDLFLDAEQRAARRGDIESALGWITTAGYVYESTGHLWRAADAYHQALALALRIDSKEDIVNSLESLAHLAIDTGHPDEADGYLRQLDPLIRANGNHLDALDVTLAQARIAAIRHQDQQAETLFRSVDSDPASQITMRLAAEHFLANLYEQQGSLDAAKAEYVTALGTFESERDQLKNENSRLPFFANATPIYDDYIHLLISQGEVNQALAAADQSRARTLAQGLGLAQTADPVGLHPGAIARSAGATLLFYWLGQKQSYLWAVTPEKTSVFTLPAESGIAPYLDRYRQTLLGPDDPARDPDGEALYRILVAPVAGLIRAGARVVTLTDGILSQLNFETLIVPGPTPHYFIEDADIVSAPSLHMLAAARREPRTTRKLLLLGDAVSPDPDYPQLPNAGAEMQEIRKHFSPGDETVFAGPRATPNAYLASGPGRFSDIDFVAHGVASRTDPLDSAIILSRPGSSRSSASGAGVANNNEADATFKLYARDIIQHPIDARLVTISTCSGSGSRSYAGEGLVGLSWAFLHAGAHNVIAALWEASDASTPRLMDSLYAGLEQGLPPSAALRQAKLILLHSSSAFRRPFYWAPFQLYTGL